MSATDGVIDASFVEEKGTSLAVAEPVGSVALFNTDDPVEVIQKATRIADALKDVIMQRGLVSKIGAKEYPQVEAWQVFRRDAGRFAGCRMDAPGRRRLGSARARLQQARPSHFIG